MSHGGRFAKKKQELTIQHQNHYLALIVLLRVFDRHAESRKILNQNFRTQSIFPN